jgi:hypothetical protein
MSLPLLMDTDRRGELESAGFARYAATVHSRKAAAA